MSTDKIENLSDLLRPYLGESKIIIDSKIVRLTAPGENYGSVVVKVDLILRNTTSNSEEELHAVAKLIPEQEFFRKLFHIDVSCKVEIAFYDTIVPTLQQFQREKGVGKIMDFFPKLYAGRINLNGSDVVDEQAVLMLENVAAIGKQYIIGVDI